MSIGCGAIVDKIRNKKAAEKADMIREVGLKQAVLVDDSIEFTRTGRGYYHSKDGVKKGGLLGLAVGGIDALSIYLFDKEATRKAFDSPKGKITGVVFSALIYGRGGLIMGKITDHLANNDARKNG